MHPLSEQADDDTAQLRNRVKLRLLLAGVAPEVVEAVDDETPVIDLLRDAVMWRDEPRITIEEVAARAGVEVEVCRRARMLLGLADPGDDAVCRVEEVDAFRGLGLGIAAFGAEPVLHFTRVLGSALANVAEATLTVFGRSMTEGSSELNRYEYALAAFDALESFAVVPEVLAVVARLQFGLANERLRTNPDLPQAGAVGFVDLTGSTQATVRHDPVELAAALTQWESRAVELAGANGGRVVKFIGDEVMFHCSTLAGGVEVARGLLEAAAASPLLGDAHGGVAMGELWGRDGDWYGTTVNVAARLVERAKRGRILLAGEGADRIEGAVGRGRVRLRGLPERVEVWRLRVD